MATNINNNNNSNNNNKNMHASFEVGSFVKLHGLQAKPELNGQLGVIKQYHNGQSRYEVIPSRGKGTLAIKPANLAQGDSVINSPDDAFRERKYQVAAFWPPVGNTIPMQKLDGWPSNCSAEISYLQQRLGMKTPKLLCGIENEGCAKPDFQMYFDAGNSESTKNKVAQAIVDLLPDYELSKVGDDARHKHLRGVCVLTYSPLISMTFSSGGLPEVTLPSDGTRNVSGNPNRKFSLEQLQKVLAFHQTPRAHAQYTAHDNPMHRMFGDMM